MQLATPAACTTGDWLQKFTCARHQPANPAVAHAGYAVGHGPIVAIVALVAILVILSAIRGRKGTPAASR